MASDQDIQTASYELPLAQDQPVDSEAKVAESPLPEPLLVQNVQWFCQFRWMVIATLAAFGVFGLFPGLIARVGMRAPGLWPFVTAAILTATNLIFLAWARAK
ncbi:MAG: hypothetical protein P8Z79_14995 [Sedimentisphaerales bacterium]